MSEGSPVLAVSDLSKAYVTPSGETKTVVRIAAFSVPACAQIALRGESGSGKTTFLHLVSGILRPDAGIIHLAGVELTALRESQRDRLRATTIGCVYQTFNLLQGYTCLENVLQAMAFGRGRDRAFARALLDRVGMSHRVAYRPRQLSVGQQQRVAVARALANRPKLVLADEPTGNLDAGTAAATLQLLRDACAEHGAALLLVSHDRHILDQFGTVAEFSALNQLANI